MQSYLLFIKFNFIFLIKNRIYGIFISGLMVNPKVSQEVLIKSQRFDDILNKILTNWIIFESIYDRKVYIKSLICVFFIFSY